MTILTDKIEQLAAGVYGQIGGVYPYFTAVIRYLLPIFALLVLVRCGKSLLREKFEPEEWGILTMAGGIKYTLYHWENTIGRAKSSDVCINYPTVSRSHGAIIRDSGGRWNVYDLHSKTGIRVNGEKVFGSREVKSGDMISIGGAEMVFLPIDKTGERIQAESRTRPGRIIKPGMTLFLLTLFQIFLGIQCCIAGKDSLNGLIPIGFLCLIILMWVTYFITRALRRTAFEVETIAFMMSSVGMAVTATSVPGDMLKQAAFIIAGLVVYFALGWFLRDLDRAKKMRWPIAAAGLFLLGINLVLSEAVFGAKNWLSIGGFSFQPSEFVKICFIFVGAATLDRLFAKRNLILFIGFAGCCVMALVLMSDFGTAIIFFVTYLVISFLRSGSIATVFLSVGGAVFAGMLAISMRPYIASRFSTWRHAWDFVNEGGYQQTRTMSAAASGGLFGVGACEGWLHNVVAANTDMVFGVVCEELGLLIALILIACIVLMAVYVVKYAEAARSSFYTIAACAAAGLFVFQLTLNVLGCVDILPFTGVTFPFVSKGGSSLVACWGLLAYIKACDTRQNASFTVKMPKKVRYTGEFEDTQDLYSDDGNENDGFNTDFSDTDWRWDDE